MKKSIISTFMLVLFIGLFVGCGKKKEDTPSITDVTKEVLDEVEKAKIGAAETTADGVKREVQTYYYSVLLENGTFNKTIFTCSDYGCSTENETLDLTGTGPTSGTITINADGTIEFKDIVINGYNCEIPNSGASTCK